jgi:hypothetical protein
VAGVEESVGDDDLTSVFGRQLVEHSRSYPAAGWWGEVEGALVFPTAAQRLMQGEITAEEAAAETNAAIQAAVA